MLSNKWYDYGKWVAQYILPGAATLYFAVSGIWGLPYQKEIVGSIVAVNVWLSALLAVSNAQWQAVMIDVLKDDADYVQIPGAPFGLNAYSYNLLKWITLAFLPASGALYFTLATLWRFPLGEQVAATVAAVTAFMGLVLGVSKAKYDQAK